MHNSLKKLLADINQNKITKDFTEKHWNKIIELSKELKEIFEAELLDNAAEARLKIAELEKMKNANDQEGKDLLGEFQNLKQEELILKRSKEKTKNELAEGKLKKRKLDEEAVNLDKEIKMLEQMKAEFLEELRLKERELNNLVHNKD